MDDVIDSSNERIVTASTFDNQEHQESETIDIRETKIHCEKNTLDASNVGNSQDIQPDVGMEFESIEKVKQFYTAFAKNRGFGIRVRSSKEKRAIFVCCNEGQCKVKSSTNEELEDVKSQTKRKCSTFRTGCQASLIVSRGTTKSNWIIDSFNNNHNHDMVSPKSVSYMRCHKKMGVAAKCLVEKFEEEGMSTGKVASIFNTSETSFTNRDCWNHVRNLWRKNLDIGDAQAVFNYCKRKQAENPNFFFAVQCDNDSRMINFFWIDARSRLTYQEFGDVITFDTTYKTNKYNMPFAPFTGLNNHYQSILFGCALLQDESESSFIWLFETWLEAMNGKKPTSIITDQDLAIRAALAKVFPETRHRLCLWHIRKKFPEKLAHIYHKRSVFKRELKQCIRDSSSIQVFEEDWQRLIVEYKLEKNDWLQGLYKIKESWIPIYNRSTFFVGMNTTQRSESINAFFDSFVDATTTLQEFVLKFEKAMDSRLEAEKREDYESRHKTRILHTGSKLEEHASLVYTRNIFGKFQDELRKINQFTKQKINRDGPKYVYQVSNCYDARDSFTVDIDLQLQTAKCGCQLFEFMGILCRHILVIFQAKGIVQIPSDFILQRWTKDANRFIEAIYSETSFDSQHNTSRISRRVHAQHEASILVDLAEESEEIYKFIISELAHTRQLAIAMKSDLQIGDEVTRLESSHNNVDHCMLEQMNETMQLTIGDPLISNTKGRRKDGEKVSDGKLTGGGAIQKSLVKNIF